jgi:SAM-dependent methyltransferase
VPIPFTNPYTQADLRQLESLLTPLLAEHFPQNDNNLQALNIACGRADETGLLVRALSPLCQQLQITGIDIRERELDEARQRWTSHPAAQLYFIKQDASRLHLIQALPDTVDLILMRHQNFWNGAETWVRIYDSALRKLSPKGRLVITSYFDLEHQQAVRAISALGAELLHTFKNPNSRFLSRQPLKSVDRHIAVFSKA